MKGKLLILWITLFGFISVRAQNVGIGQASPASKLDVYGGAAIGASYSGTYVAPTNGAIVQGSVGIGNYNPNGNAILDLTNSSNLGLVLPSASSEPSASTALNGLTFYNSVTNCLDMISNGSWQPVYCPCPTLTAASITGTSVVCSGSANVYTVAVTPGVASYTWSTTAGSVSSPSTGVNTVTVTAPSSGAFTVQCVVSNACATSSVTATMACSIFNATPTVTGVNTSSTAYTTVGYNQPAVVYTLPAGGTGYSWSVAGSGYTPSLSGTSTNSVTASWSSTTATIGTANTVTITGSYSQCSTTATGTVTVTAGGTNTYNYSSAATQTWGGSTYDVSTVNAKIWGAGGGGGYEAAGGSGAYMYGTLNYLGAPTSLYLVVGQAGGIGGATTYGGGGAGYSGLSGSGGGYSGIFSSSTISQANALAIAGGGGGGGYYSYTAYSYGGGGGAPTGVAGGNSGTGGGGSGGNNTTLIGTGGIGSATTYNGGAGTALVGGTGNSYNLKFPGGGGGGGYYGGGGGAGGSTKYYSGGGGGGSSYPSLSTTLFTIITNTAGNTGSYNTVTAPGSPASGIGSGGNDIPSAGGSGQIILYY